LYTKETLDLYIQTDHRLLWSADDLNPTRYQKRQTTKNDGLAHPAQYTKATSVSP